VSARLQFIDRLNGGPGWRLLSGNNRALAVGPQVHRRPEDQLKAVRKLLRGADPVVRRGSDGGWRWELPADSAVEVRCPQSFARRIDARRAFQRLTEAVESAAPVASART
jgi:hypothetical protein